MRMCDRLEKSGGERTILAHSLLMTKLASLVLYTVPSIHLKREAYFLFKLSVPYRNLLLPLAFSPLISLTRVLVSEFKWSPVFLHNQTNLGNLFTSASHTTLTSTTPPFEHGQPPRMPSSSVARLLVP